MMLDATSVLIDLNESIITGGDVPGHEFHGNQWTEGQGISIVRKGDKPLYSKKDGEPLLDTWGNHRQGGGKWVVSETGKPLPPWAREHEGKINPMWRKAEIAPSESAAKKSGMIASGRKQNPEKERAYLYHPDFLKKNADNKWSRGQEVMEKEQALVNENEADLKSKNPQIRENAAVFKFMHETGTRPDSTGTKGQNYGATTLEGRHVRIDSEGGVHLFYLGKKGTRVNVPVMDEDRDGVSQMLKERKKAAGDHGQLFKTTYQGASDYISAMDGGKFTAKDLRTLKGTKSAMRVMEGMRDPKDPAEYKKFVKKVGRAVGAKLGHSDAGTTGSTALKNYISPYVFSEWKKKAGVE